MIMHWSIIEIKYIFYEHSLLPGEMEEAICDLLGCVQ